MGLFSQHWTPRSDNRNIVEEDDEDETGFANFDPISVFAEPVQRKEKKNLDLSYWKEAMQGDYLSQRKGREANQSDVGKTERQMMDRKAMKDLGNKSMLSNSFGAHADVASMDVESHLNADRPLAIAEEARRSELSASSVTEMDLDDSLQLQKEEHVKDHDSEIFSKESGTMVVDGQVIVKRICHNDSANVEFRRMDKIDTMVPEQFRNLGNERGSMSLESEIDAENRARLENMSPEEIKEAQAEIMQKMDPALLNLLKKRGQEKLKKQIDTHSNHAAESQLGIRRENQSNNAMKAPHIDSNNPTVTTSSNIIKSGLDNGVKQNVDSVRGSLWDAWSQRVEAVRELRFSLDGTVVDNDFVQMPEIRKAKS